MSTELYRERGYYQRPVYDERELLMSDRFLPGEFGAVIIMAIASLLLWSAAVYGLTTEPKAKVSNQPAAVSTAPGNSAY